ncbi:MAG: hypothetical protein KGZ71_01915 [Desulfobulbaceae bacterium]|nr:hypothetical protein [Candidatus Kapabacteria bacterium]MBS3999219.1 hypothetical protein [Desulfobulbaceae bacterium]
MLQIINFCLENVIKRKILSVVIMSVIVLGLVSSDLHSQSSSPASWLYPDGNLQATRYVLHKSDPQTIDSFSVKWSTPLISGDVRPLIGNLASFPPLTDFKYAPNQIAAVMGDDIIILSGTGSLINKSGFPSYVSGVKGISCLIDTNSQTYSPVTGNFVMGLESIETFNPLDRDSLAFSYLFGYDVLSDSIRPLKRLAINLRPFAPNIFGSVKPFFGRKIDGKLMVYATINMTQPKVLDPTQIEPPFFRGMTQFHEGVNTSTFPLPDIQDVSSNRAFLGAEVNTGQPSLFVSPDGNGRVLLPSYPTPEAIDPNFNDLLVSSFLNSQYLETYADVASLVGLNLNNTITTPAFFPFEIIPDDGTRPNIRPYYVDITDNWTGERGFILVAEEYNGLDGSDGTPKIHLHNRDGAPLTDYFTGSTVNPHFRGDTNHYWSVAIGNVDGAVSNFWEEFYPNNRGNEIIVTQSSREFAHPASKLFVLRYFTGAAVKKPTPTGENLFQLDTIFSARINGWVAAVNDLDNAPDNKDEIVLADGGKLMVVRLRNYEDTRFRLGNPFDTVFVHEFFNQAISHVAIADLEGDGRNDIIVTTYDSTYVIGTIIPNTLSVISPKDSTHQTIFCLGDTVKVSWTNTIRSQRNVRIDFIEYIGGIPTENKTTLVEFADNNADTLTLSFVADASFAGKQGIIIVEGVSDPDKLRDITALLTFNEPMILPDILPEPFYHMNDQITLMGRADCADSVFAEWSADDTNWTFAGATPLMMDGSYMFDLQINCIPELFLCDRLNQDTLIKYRVVAVKSEFSDTSLVTPIALRPIKIPIKFDPIISADPTRVFYWEQIDFDSAANCTQISISISIDGGREFMQIGEANIADEIFEWDVPVNIPDELIFRFCCVNSCAGIDTTIDGVTPKFIDIIAPNPFNPITEQLSIVYKVNQETNVTIKILDQNNKVVAIPIENVQRMPGIAYGDSWDGIRADGAYVANGIYYISLELSNGIREIYPLYIRK